MVSIIHHNTLCVVYFTLLFKRLVVSIDELLLVLERDLADEGVVGYALLCYCALDRYSGPHGLAYVSFVDCEEFCVWRYYVEDVVDTGVEESEFFRSLALDELPFRVHENLGEEELLDVRIDYFELWPSAILLFEYHPQDLWDKNKVLVYLQILLQLPLELKRLQMWIIYLRRFVESVLESIFILISR